MEERLVGPVSGLKGNEITPVVVILEWSNLIGIKCPRIVTT